MQKYLQDDFLKGINSYTYFDGLKIYAYEDLSVEQLREIIFRLTSDEYMLMENEIRRVERQVTNPNVMIEPII